MSLNHIIKDIVPDDERLSVKFDVVECNELIIDGDTSDYYGSVSTSYTGQQFGGDLSLPTARIDYCNRLGDAFNVGYTGTAVMTSPNAVESWSITCPYPTKIRELIASNNSIININNLFSTGEAHILTQTVDLKGHHFYVASSEPAPGLETTHIKINFVSLGRVPATTGGFSLEWRISHHSAGNPPV
jgi:hypothetical protein